MTVTAPTSLAGALAALADDPSSLVLAGGTDLMVQVNEGHRRPGPGPVLALAGVPELRAVTRDGDTLVVGSGVTTAARSMKSAMLTITSAWTRCAADGMAVTTGCCGAGPRCDHRSPDAWRRSRRRRSPRC